MAAVQFSWAQVAKGSAHPASPQTTSSKVTSGTASPANAALTDITPGSNWADDVEASVGEKASGTTMKEQEESKPILPKETAVEHAKADERSQDVTSGISSPDLAASASTTTKDDDETSAQNGASSESTWDAKSQTSEPAWIADRKERQQNGSQSHEDPSKGDKNNNEDTPPTPKQPVLQEAAPPAVNVWQQRIESQKAKMAAQTKSSPAIPATTSPALKENQRPQAGARKKANSVTGIPRETITIPSEDISKAVESKPAANESRSDSPLTGSTKATSTDRESEQARPAPLPTVKDDRQWPTPECVPDKERKASTTKESDTQRNEDTTPTVKKAKQWEKFTIPVTPMTYKSEFKENKPRGPQNGERSGRNGSGSKRPPRGTSNPSGDRDKEYLRSSSTPNNGEGVSSVQENVPVAGDPSTTPAPLKPSRASSSSPRGQQKKDSLPGRKFSRPTTGDVVQSDSVQDNGRPAASRDGNSYRPGQEPRRTKSPKKMSLSEDNLPEEFVPAPIPRRSSIGTQTADVGDNIESNTHEAPPTRPAQFDSRKETRNTEGARDPNYQAPRGGKRGGRGRGGNTPRDFTNGHPTFGATSNTYGTDFPAASPYGIVQSPTLPGPRGNHQFSYASPRGTWRGNPRSHSIPLETYYNQSPRAGYPGAHQAMHGIQTFVPPMYDQNAYPASTFPYSSQMEDQQLRETLLWQVEYYFSMGNMIKDMFLRKHMDSQGFVFLDLIANFNRIKQLTPDRELVKAVCVYSPKIEVFRGEDSKERLRARDKWEQFVLPMEQREPSAQTAGPERLEPLQPSHLSLNTGIPPQYQGPASAGLPNMHQQFSRRSYDSTYPMVNGYPPQFATYPGYAEGMYTESINGDEPRGRTAKSPIHENVASPMETPIAPALGISRSDGDAFPDDKMSDLTVVVKSRREDTAPYHTAASRTFSNGSIDSRSILSEMNKPSESKSPAPTHGETLTNGSDNILSLTRTLSPSKSPAHDRGTPSPDANVLWVKDRDFPVSTLPENLIPEPYHQLRQRALDDRGRAVTGNCPYDLDILYQFWCHFLLRNFNHSMYSEFKHYANDDARNRYSFTGLNNLVQYYSKSLSSQNPIRDRVVKDYVELVRNEPPKMEGAAFKTLRSAWRNGALNLKNRKKLADVLDEHLKLQLDRIEI